MGNGMECNGVCCLSYHNKGFLEMFFLPGSIGESRKTIKYIRIDLFLGKKKNYIRVLYRGLRDFGEMGRAEFRVIDILSSNYEGNDPIGKIWLTQALSRLTIMVHPSSYT